MEKLQDPESKIETNDREARIKSRRLRVEQKNASKNDQNRSRQSQVSLGKTQTRGQKQIGESLNHLDRKKLDGIEEVTNVRVEIDNSEMNRRIHEENLRRNRVERLEEEAITSGKRNAAVELRWSELLDYTMPQELYNEMQAQKSNCDVIMQSKDGLIKEFQTQLKLKDEEYVRTLKKQSEDVQILIERMGKQFKEMQEEYELELEQIEDAFLRERDELLSNNKTEIDSLFDKRRSMEMAYMDAKQARDEQYQKEIEELRVKDAEDYSKLKIKLETDIQTLEQQLEEMRATYQLNTEKLEYNYRVLTERDMENSATLSQQKRKLARLKEALSSLMAKYNQTDARDKNQNQELTEEYKRLTKQYKDLQEKFRHFEHADQDKYQQVYEMHLSETQELMSRILQSDKIIHEQQLGLKWIEPSALITTTTLRDQQEEVLEPMMHEKIEISGQKLGMMLELLSNEAGFLIDPKLLHSIDSKESQVMRAEAIFQSLGISTEKDVEKLMNYFFHDDIQEIKDLGLKITPDDVISVITAFVQEHQSTSSVGISNSPIRKQKVKNQSQKDKDQWKRMARIIPDSTLRVWSAVEKGLTKYNTVLDSRANAITQVNQLQEQNTQLKSLLRQYLGSQVNDNLLIPPTQTIRLHPNH